jgi:hypothetical protein
LGETPLGRGALDTTQFASQVTTFIESNQCASSSAVPRSWQQGLSEMLHPWSRPSSKAQEP